MDIATAKTQAYERGLGMQPTPGKPFAHSGVDIADIASACLDELMPLSSMPDEADSPDEFKAWRKRQDEIRNDIWDEYASGVRGERKTS